MRGALLSRRGPIEASGAVAAFTPLSLPNLFIWLDMADTATITDAGSGHCSQINDKSGAGRNFTQGTDANRPITGTTTLNSKNTLSFNGTSQTMLSGTVAVGASTTIFTVAKSSTTSGYPRGAFTSDNGTRICQHRWGSQAAPNTIGFNGGTVRSISGTSADATAAHVFVSRLDSSGGVITNFLNGTQNGNLTSTGTLNSGSIAVALGCANINVGSPTSLWAGQIGELIICNSALSTADRNACEAYLKAKWATP